MNLYNYVGAGGSGKKYNSTQSKSGFKWWQIAVLALFGVVLICLVVFCLALKKNANEAAEEKTSEFINRADEVMFNAYSLSFDLTISTPDFLPSVITDYYGSGETYLRGVITKTGAFGLITSEEWRIYPTFFVVTSEGTYLSTGELAYILETKDDLSHEGFFNSAGDLWNEEHPDTYIKVGDGKTGQEILSELREVLSDRCFADAECEDGHMVKGGKFERLENKGFFTDAYFSYVKGCELEITLSETEDENGNLENLLTASGEKGSFTLTFTENRQYIANPVITDVISHEEFARQVNELIEESRSEFAEDAEQ